MSERASLRLLGAVAIEVGGRTTPLRGGQNRVVLAHTALRRGQPIPVEELAAIVWPDALGCHWRGALRGLVAKVRTFLLPLEAAGVELRCHGGSYSFACPDPRVVDVYLAEGLEQTARECLRSQDHACAARHAADAAAILRQPLLPGVDDAWVLPRRLALAAISHRARWIESEARSKMGQHERAVAVAQAAIDDDPYEEASHRALLAAHLAAGDRTTGLRAYERFRRLARDELGVAPDERTQALYLRLLGPDGTGVDGPPTGRGPARTTERVEVRHRFPADNSPGRIREWFEATSQAAVHATALGDHDQALMWWQRALELLESRPGLGSVHEVLREIDACRTRMRATVVDLSVPVVTATH